MNLYLLILVAVAACFGWWYLRMRSRASILEDEGEYVPEIIEAPGHDKSITNNTQEIAVPLVYYGHDLNLPDEVIIRILRKHFPYYNRLLDVDQEKFISRVQKFIESKVFIIHDRQGYREMPVLLSAAAVQLTFGLKRYMLSHFSVIQIYPQEFIGLEPFRVLIGNVSGNTINIAWKQFLEGYKNNKDNHNVGLHEMAHALYYQNFESDYQNDQAFRESFDRFNAIGDRIFSREKRSSIGLYSSYAVKNFQEFWAESIEIFFENPQRMHRLYPDLYECLCGILNQNPLRYPHHLFGEN